MEDLINNDLAKMPRTPRVFTEAWRRKLSIAQSGRKVSEAQRVKLSVAQKARWAKVPKDQRSAMVTAEARAKMSKARGLRVVTDETRRRISASSKGRMLGYRHSAESKEKMAESQPRGVNSHRFGKIAYDRKFFGSKEDLLRMRIEEQKTLTQIAEYYQVSVAALGKWIKRLGIKFTEEQILDRNARKRLAARKPSRTTAYGYVVVHSPAHPNCNKDGFMFEHRLVVEEAIGRMLTGIEVVHHLGHVRSDNRLENLLLLPSNRAHTAFHMWLGMVGAYTMGFAANPPADFACGAPMFYRGKWVQEVKYGQSCIAIEMTA